MGSNEASNFSTKNSQTSYKLGKGPIRKPLPAVVLSDAENKDALIPAFRIESSYFEKLMQKMEKFFKGKKIVKSKYMTNLIKKDISDMDDFSTNDELVKEMRLFAVQHNKLGNNLNQIAHGINLLKRKRYLSKEDRQNITNYYEELRIIKERYQIVTKKFTSIKIQ